MTLADVFWTELEACSPRVFRYKARVIFVRATAVHLIWMANKCEIALLPLPTCLGLIHLWVALDLGGIWAHSCKQPSNGTACSLPAELLGHAERCSGHLTKGLMVPCPNCSSTYPRSSNATTQHKFFGCVYEWVQVKPRPKTFHSWFS